MSSFLNRVVWTASSGSTGSFVQGSSVTGYQLMAAAGALSGITYGYDAQSTDLTQWEYGSGVWTSSNNTLARNPLGNNLGSTALINFTNPPQVMITLLAQDAALQSSTGNLTFFIGSSGDDATAVPGSSVFTYLTAQAAFNAIQHYNWGVGNFTPKMKWLAGVYGPTVCGLVIFDFPGGNFITLEGDLTTPANVELQNGVEIIASDVEVNIGGFKYNVNQGTIGSCINPVNGSVVINGPLTFAGNATPFYLEGPTCGFVCGGQTITVTSTEIPWFLYAGPGTVTFHTGNTINLPAALTVDNSFIEIHGFKDQAIQGGASYFQLPTTTWTNFGGVIGINLIAQGIVEIVTQSGELSDIPGTNTPQYFGDDFPKISGFSAKSGFVLHTKTGTPTSTDLPQNTKTIVYDTGGGGIYSIAAFSTVHVTPIPSYDLRKSSTVNLTLDASYSGWHFDNQGSTGEIDWSLPAPQPGMTFDFCNTSTQITKVRANDSTTTKIGTSTINSIGGGYLSIANSTSSVFAYLGVEAISTTQWVARYVTGPWLVSTGSTV